MARFLASDGKAATGERVIDPLCERTFAHNGEFGRGGKRAADERAESEGQRRFRGQWIDWCRSLTQQQPCSEAAAAEKTAQDVCRQKNRRNLAAGRIHAQGFAVVAER